MKFTAAFAALAAGAALALPSAAQDYTLDLSEDPSPNDEVVFTFTLPYELNDLDEMVTTFSFRCQVSVGLPRDAGGATFNFTNFRSRTGVDLSETPVGADGYRNASGEVVVEVPVPHDQVEKMRLPESGNWYQCTPAIAIGGLTYGIYEIQGDEAGNLSFPDWARGTGNGVVSGKIVLPAPRDPTPAQVEDGVDTSVVTPQRPALPRTTPRLPGKKN